MISVDVYEGNKVRCNAAPEQIKDLVAAGKQILWVDVQAPTEEEWDLIKAQFDFHPLAMEDARNQNQRAKADMYGGYLFLSLRAWRGFQSPVDSLYEVTDEIDVFLGAT